jgi:hypothetical protein
MLSHEVGNQSAELRLVEVLIQKAATESLGGEVMEVGMRRG